MLTPNARSNVVLGVALAYFSATALCGIGWSHPEGLDFYSFYTASAAALQGRDPYDATQLQAQYAMLGLAGTVNPYYYPPAWTLLFAPFTLLPVSNALIAWKAMNVVLLAVCIRLSLQLYDFRPAGDVRAKYLVAYALMMSPTLSLLLLGQSTFAVVAFLLLFATFYERSVTLAGVALSLACIKPHLAWPFVLWITLKRDFQMIGVVVLVNVLCVATYLFLCNVSLVGLLTSFHSALMGWGRYPSNSIDSVQNIGVAAGLHGILSIPNGVALAVALAVGFTAVSMAARTGQSGLPIEEALPVLLLAGLVAVTVHPYDLVGVIPVCAWLLSREDSHARRIGLLLALVLIVPLRAIEGVQEFAPEGIRRVSNHYRSLVLVGLMVVSVVQLLRVEGHRAHRRPA